MQRYSYKVPIGHNCHYAGVELRYFRTNLRTAYLSEATNSQIHCCVRTFPFLQHQLFTNVYSWYFNIR